MWRAYQSSVCCAQNNDRSNTAYCMLNDIMCRHERGEGFLLEETLQCGCGHGTCPTLLLSNGPYFENKTSKDQCIVCNASPSGANHLNNCTSNHFSIYRNTFPTITIFNRRSTQSNLNIKSSWTPMILELWIPRFHKTRIWFIYSTTRPTNKQTNTFWLLDTCLQWCSVFQKCLLYSKLSFERHWDSSCYHRSTFCCYFFLSLCCIVLLEVVITDNLSCLSVPYLI